jgi:hypothetical protein
MIGAKNASVQNLKVDNYVHATQGNGISMVPDGAGNNTTYSYVGGNTVAGNPDHEYLIWNLAGQHNTITGNTVIGNTATLAAPNEQEGIESYGGHYVTISNNTLTGMGTDAINIVQNDSGAGFDTSLGNITLSGNTITSAYNGINIYTESPASNISVLNNAAGTNWNVGIYAIASTAGPFNNLLINSNTLTGQTSQGISLITPIGSVPWSGAVVSGNSVTLTSTGAGTDALNSSAINVLWSGNTAVGGSYTVAASVSTNNTFNGNTISGWANAPYIVGTNMSLSGEHVLITDASTPSLTFTWANQLLSAGSPSTNVTITLWEAIPGFGSSNVTLPAGVTMGPLTSLDGGITWTGTVTQTGVTGSGLISVNLSGAWASSGSVSGVVSNVSWISYGGAGPYAPLNFVSSPELYPLSALFSNNNSTSVSFPYVGLTNGVHWPDGGVPGSDANAYSYTLTPFPITPSTNYTISVYVQKDDLGDPNTATTGTSWGFRAPEGQYGATIGYGSGGKTCNLISGAVYRCWATFNSGAYSPVAQVAGVGRTQNGTAGTNWPGALSGLQVNVGTTPTTYSGGP